MVHFDTMDSFIGHTGQFYNISLRDKDQFDGEIKSTISITFHDENHRLSAPDYWKYWLSQQKQIDEARAVEIGIKGDKYLLPIEKPKIFFLFIIL